MQLIMITIYPTLIQPLFNKVESLPEGDLRTAIESLASRISYPLKKLFVIDGSKRSSHSNAYMYGFGQNKRIVLFDTLVEHSTTEEVCAVLAHELGHWSLSHTLKILTVTQGHLLVLFWLFGQFVGCGEMYTSFGFPPGVRPVLVGFILFGYVYSPVESLLGFAINVYSRKNEFEAGGVQVPSFSYFSNVSLPSHYTLFNTQTPLPKSWAMVILSARLLLSSTSLIRAM